MPSRFLQDTSLKTRHSTVQLMQYTELKVKKLSHFCDYFRLVFCIVLYVNIQYFWIKSIQLLVVCFCAFLISTDIFSKKCICAY